MPILRDLRRFLRPRSRETAVRPGGAAVPRSPEGSAATDRAPLRGTQADGLLRMEPETAPAARGSAAPHTPRLVEPRGQVEIRSTVEEVARLVRSLDGHMTAQGERSARLADAMESLPGSLGSLPEISRAHARLLEAIGDMSESSQKRHDRLAESLARIAGQTARHAETSESLVRHVESQAQETARIARAAEELRDAMTASSRSQAAASEAIARAAQAIASQGQQTSVGLRRLHAWIIAALLLSALAGAAATAIGLTLLLR
ncbi:MAG: hypothetical protein KF817_06065 [Phycisphaeraceae bacterium]|nr:hypothetical protein [Phycisphaeraceae bacterium]